MIGKNEVSKTLDGASCAASMFLGGMLAAEHAVLNGIAATATNYELKGNS
jgi:hypothetical protein